MFQDFYAGAKRVSLWQTLAWQDIKGRYRRTVLGPLWLTVSTGVFISAVGILYAGIFGQSPENYIPHFAIGMIIWHFIFGTIQSQSIVFINSSNVATNLSIQKSVFIYHQTVKEFYIFLHNFIIIILVMLIFNIPWSFAQLTSLLGIALIALNGFFFAISVGVVCLRYRDIPHIIANIMQVMFFLTPVVWKIDNLAKSKNLATVMTLNPFYHFIEIVRWPFLHAEPAPALSWQITLTITVVFGLASIVFYRQQLNKIPYWY
jgi:ABC-2 type transport system permease protein